MSLSISQSAVTAKELINKIFSFKSMVFKDSSEYEKPTNSEDLTLAGATGSIRAYNKDGVIRIMGAYTGWTSGAIATLSEDFRPFTNTTLNDVLITPAGAITPQTDANSNFSGDYFNDAGLTGFEELPAWFLLL